MEQSLNQLREELSTFDGNGVGYLKYIQSKYPKENRNEQGYTEIEKEWQDEYQKYLMSDTINQEKTIPLVSVSNLSLEEKEEAFELLLNNGSSGGFLNNLNSTIVDNFCIDSSSEAEVDLGGYIPSGLDRSITNNQLYSDSPLSSIIPTGTYVSNNFNNNNNDINYLDINRYDDNSNIKNTYSVDYIEDLIVEDDDDDEEKESNGSEDDDFNDTDMLPFRASKALNSYREMEKNNNNNDGNNDNSSSDINRDNEDNVYSVSDVKEISIVYDFEEEGEGDEPLPPPPPTNSVHF